MIKPAGRLGAASSCSPPWPAPPPPTAASTASSISSAPPTSTPSPGTGGWPKACRPTATSPCSAGRAPATPISSATSRRTTSMRARCRASAPRKAPGMFLGLLIERRRRRPRGHLVARSHARWQIEQIYGDDDGANIVTRHTSADLGLDGHGDRRDPTAGRRCGRCPGAPGERGARTFEQPGDRRRGCSPTPISRRRPPNSRIAGAAGGGLAARRHQRLRRRLGSGRRQRCVHFHPADQLVYTQAHRLGDRAAGRVRADRRAAEAAHAGPAPAGDLAGGARRALRAGQLHRPDHAAGARPAPDRLRCAAACAPCATPSPTTSSPCRHTSRRCSCRSIPSLLDVAALSHSSTPVQRRAGLDVCRRLTPSGCRRRRAAGQRHCGRRSGRSAAHAADLRRRRRDRLSRSAAVVLGFASTAAQARAAVASRDGARAQIVADARRRAGRLVGGGCACRRRRRAEALRRGAPRADQSARRHRRAPPAPSSPRSRASRRTTSTGRATATFFNVALDVSGQSALADATRRPVRRLAAADERCRRRR